MSLSPKKNAKKKGAVPFVPNPADAIDPDASDYANMIEIDWLLQNRKLSWVFELNNLRIDSPTFSKIAKVVFSTKSTAYENIKVAAFSHCGLTDEFLPSLLGIMRCKNLAAIDLSHNDLSEIFIDNLFTILKVNRQINAFSFFYILHYV